MGTQSTIDSAMADVDGMLIKDPGGPESAGAIFVLNRPARASTVVTPEQGWIVEVRKGSKCLVARTDRAKDYHDVLVRGLRAAQRGLDIVAVSSDGDSSIVDVEDEHLTWWPERTGTVLRLTSIVSFSAPTFSAVGIVVGADGQVKESPAIPPVVWHESFRYYRLAQTTDDLADAYRNMYLALESILDDIAPKQKKEGEGVWLKRALGEANKIVTLSVFAPSGTGSDVDRIHDDIYIDKRNGVFHSKTTKPHMLPHDAMWRPALQESLKRLSLLYVDLAAKHLNARLRRSSWSQYAFLAMADAMMKGAKVYFSDDQLPLESGDPPKSSEGRMVVEVPYREVPTLDQPFVKVFLASSPPGIPKQLGRLAQAVTSVAGEMFTSTTVEGNLNLEGIETVELMLGVRMKQSRQPRTLYST